ncbi:MAG: hypothetical protein ACOC0E_11790 [Spirochaetota bacterium]
MNQDQVKERLVRLDDEVQEFSLVFSGKTSKRANGVYHPETREIVIHNRNFDNDNALMYTAIHEFAHHVHFTTSAVPVGPRAHTLEFRSILHRLLVRAEEIGVYLNPFESDAEFEALTRRLKTEFLERNGEMMKRFGQALIEAERLCRARGARFEDYVERVLSMDRTTATTLMKLHTYNIDPSIGYSNMTTVAGLTSDEKRTQAERAFLAGQTPDQVKTAVRAKPEETEDPVRKLEKERGRIERTIRSLQTRLGEIEERLVSMTDRPTGSPDREVE